VELNHRKVSKMTRDQDHLYKTNAETKTHVHETKTKTLPLSSRSPRDQDHGLEDYSGSYTPLMILVFFGEMK